ncbi:hypothetical protein JCM10908_006223 [Rhodotorula pacifica]|uniref:uncharacterized protein n=1 Tax=Rhodotorula pacifica TaxID=1495444 RepID=UPI00316B4FEF
MWERIRIPALQACKRIADKMMADKAANRQWNRIDGLRPRYKALLKSLPDSTRPFVPLFDDFVLLPTVKTLWTTDETITDSKWVAQLPLIEEELRDYRLELTLHVRNAIIAATTDPDTPQEHPEVDLDGADWLDTDFFQLATSIVCCGFKGCPPRSKPKWNWYKRKQNPDTRKGAIGSLIDVLNHQHRFHAQSSANPSNRAKKLAYPPFRISLPLEVACGVEELLELHQLDAAVAQKRHLELASSQSGGYVYANCKSSHRYFRGADAWLHLLARLKHEGEKLATMGLCLEPPEISFMREEDYERVIDIDEVEEEDEEEEDDAKVKSEEADYDIDDETVFYEDSDEFDAKDALKKRRIEDDDSEMEDADSD